MENAPPKHVSNVLGVAAARSKQRAKGRKGAYASTARTLSVLAMKPGNPGSKTGALSHLSMLRLAANPSRPCTWMVLHLQTRMQGVSAAVDSPLRHSTTLNWTRRH